MVETAAKGKVICSSACSVSAQFDVIREMPFLGSASFLTPLNQAERVMICVCACYIISSYLWKSTPPPPPPPPPLCISARRTAEAINTGLRLFLGGILGVLSFMIRIQPESQTCHCAQSVSRDAHTRIVNDIIGLFLFLQYKIHVA